MKYTGNYKTQYSTECGENVDVLEYISKNNFPYCECSRCGKPIVRKMYVVQSESTGIELMYLGSECVKHLK